MADADAELRVGMQNGHVREESYLDLLFCLAYLEANISCTGPAIELYLDLLAALLSLRSSKGHGWIDEALHEHSESQAKAALSWICHSGGTQLQRVHPEDIKPFGADPELLASLEAAEHPMHLYSVNKMLPQREACFQKLKRAHGSTFAFHGSPAANWSSILRHGLRNLSSTSRMAHGSLHGAGVYLTPDAALALNYSYVSESAAYRDKKASPIGLPCPEYLRIVGLCEVVEVPAPGLSCGNGKIWVANQDGIVAVRLIFVLPAGRALPNAQLAQVLGNSLDTMKRFLQLEESTEVPELAVPRSWPASKSSLPVMSVSIPTFVQQSSHSQRPFWVFCIHTQCHSDSTADEDKEVWRVEILRRYSQFQALRNRIGDGPRAPFPGKQSLLKATVGLSRDRLETRRQELEQWLREVVSVARHGLMREELTAEFRAFLGAWRSR
jgi:hypothetical protein